MTPTIGRMDFPIEPKLKIWISNQVEASWRAEAAKKEPWTWEYIRAFPPGSVFLDIGANVGSYSIAAAALGHTVIAVEPSYANYDALCRNALLNGREVAERITPLPVALGDTPRMEWLHFSSLESGAASHTIGKAKGKGDNPAVFHRLPVMIERLDDLLARLGLPQPAFIKLDVDGGESAVIAGGEGTIRAATALLVEMPDKTEAAILERLGGWDFRRTHRFAERGGVPIPGMSMGLFVRLDALPAAADAPSA